MPKRKSCGIICCRYNRNRLEVLLIRKRNTFSFIEFVLGNYSNHKRVVYLLNNMTSEEKAEIASLDFDRMWYRVWMEININSKYLHCKEYFYNNFQNTGYLLRLLNSSSSVSTSWEIPKGRIITGETNLNCAIREFEEETGIRNIDYYILPEIIKQTFSASNICYHNTYYISLLTNYNYHPRIDYSKKQLIEVIDIQWMSLSQILALDMRIYPCIKNAFKILQKKYKIPRMISLGINIFPINFS
ncbi:MAG: NUDIX hydrolase [Nitrososphaerota archaeon]